ncbi:MAG TPA: ABC transporter substrate-binding protein, partial [Thermomicrobiales bacterium]|nr:ABC transporter substrate-binding protein [Thermomicrobiales bacterium]
GRLNRRDVLRRSVMLGLSIPAIGALLAACGDDDDGDDDAPTSTSGTGQGGETETTEEETPEGEEAESPTTAEGTEEAEASPEESPDASPTEGMGDSEMDIAVAPEVPNADEASAFSGASLTYYGDGVGIGNELDETLAAKFAEATGIEVEVIPRPESSTETFATYQRAFDAQSGDIDVMMVDVVWPGAFAPHLLDLGPAFEGAMDQWYESIVENNTIDGKFVGAPWFGDFGILYYRTDLLEKYEFDGPPTTWDELEAQATTIVEGESASNPNFTGFVFQGNAYEGLTCNALEWIASVGGGMIVEDGEVTVDNPEAIAILDQIGGWVGGIVPTGVTGYQEEDARNAFQGGNVAFMRNWPYAYSLGQADDSAVVGVFDVTGLPAGEGMDPVGTLGGWQLAVSAYSEAPEAATEFVKYMVSPEVVKWRAIVASFVPLLIDVAEDPEVIEAQPYLENLAGVTRLTRPSQSTGENYNQVSTEFFQGVNEILTGGSAEEIIPSVAQRIERLLG